MHMLTEIKPDLLTMELKILKMLQLELKKCKVLQELNFMLVKI